MKQGKTTGANVANTTWNWNRLRRVLIIVLAGLTLAKMVVAVGFRENDFSWHRRGGEQFLLGTNLGYDNYPLTRMMMNAGLALMPSKAARLLVFSLSLALLWITYRRWQKMADHESLLAPLADDLAALGGIFAFLQIWFRDLDECGLQTITLFFLSAGAYSLHRGKPLQSGFWFAMASVYKLTPILTLPFLLWKRQWKAAAAHVASIAFLLALPMLYLGPEKTLLAHRIFLQNGSEVMAERFAYPQYLGREGPRPQNQSLQALLARFVLYFPEDHPVYQASPYFIQFGVMREGLPAYYVVRGLMLCLGLFLAWYLWPRKNRSEAVDSTSTNSRLAIASCDPQLGTMSATGSSISAPPTLPIRTDEWAIVFLMCAICSPLCWKQHLVLGLPLGYLAYRQVIAQPTRFRVFLLAFLTVLILVPVYGILGRGAHVLWASYKFDTIGMLGLMALVMWTKPKPSAALGCLPDLQDQQHLPLRTAA